MSGIVTNPQADTIRAVLVRLFDNGQVQRGTYKAVADHFGVSRERVRQLAETVKPRYVGLTKRKHGLFGPEGRLA